jgi:hypothetical protein
LNKRFCLTKNTIMKKILLSSLVFFSVAMSAQNKTLITTEPGKPISKLPKTTYAAVHPQSPLSKTSSTPGSGWFNVLNYNDTVFPGVQVLSAMHLFPDSAIILGFDATNLPVYAYYHKAANYLDPSFVSQPFLNDKLATYTLDSVSVGYSYIRGSASSITDSLIIEVIAENHTLDWDIGSGDFSYQDIVYNQATNSVKAGTGLNGVTILKRLSIALKEADSTSFYSEIKVATPGIAAQTNSKKIGTVVSFKPGYTYAITDTLFDSHRTNTFFMWSSEQQGDGGGVGTDPYIFNVTGDYNSDMNMSYIIPQDIRYNQNANGWNGYFIPTYAYTTPFAFENHDIGYYLTVPLPTSVKELEEKGFSLGQNTPNPFSGSTTVNFQLAKDVNSALFTVTDIMGRVISSEKVETTAGKHSVNINSLASGVYYYSLNINGNVVTKKMIVE